MPTPTVAYTVIDHDGNVVGFDANDNQLGVIRKATFLEGPAAKTMLVIGGAALLFFIMRKR